MSFRADVHRARGLAILCIVAGHAMTNVDWLGAYEVERGLALAMRNWTVPFVFIAGYLFRHLDVGGDYRTLLRQKARRLLLPYLVVSAPLLAAFALNVVVEPRWASERWQGLGGGRYLVYVFTGAHARHFWFIPVMFTIFAMAPLWRSRPLQRGMGLHLALVLSVVVSLIIDRDADASAYPLLRVLHFASCFVWGLWVATYRTALDQHRRAVTVGMVAVAVAVVSSVGPNDPKMFAANYGLKMALCPLLLFAFNRQLPNMLDVVLGRLAELSFGIYFVHVYLLDAMRGRYTPGLRLRFFGWPGWVWATVLGLTGATVLVLLIRRAAGKWSPEVIGVRPLAAPSAQSGQLQRAGSS